MRVALRKRLVGRRHYHVLEGLGHPPLDGRPLQLQHDEEGQEHRQAGHAGRAQDGDEQHLPAAELRWCCVGDTGHAAGLVQTESGPGHLGRSRGGMRL